MAGLLHNQHISMCSLHFIKKKVINNPLQCGVERKMLTNIISIQMYNAPYHIIENY